jgi:catecholate siderophore receptor
MSSPKFTAPLREVPKSITIINEALIKERGATSLTDVLRTTPGITLGAGEGTPLGDRPFIRGFEASTDIQIDGLRDLGRMSHEAFNVESVEIVKGRARPTTAGLHGGSINLVSKAAKAETSSPAASPWVPTSCGAIPWTSTVPRAGPGVSPERHEARSRYPRPR